MANIREMIDANAWRHGLKPGDKVGIRALNFSGMTATLRIEVVERVTPARIFTATNSYHKKDGRAVGNVSSRIMQVTPALVEEAERAKLMQWLARFAYSGPKLSNISTECMRDMHAAYVKHHPEEVGK